MTWISWLRLGLAALTSTIIVSSSREATRSGRPEMVTQSPVQPEVVLPFYGYREAPLLVFFGAEAQQLGVLDVVAGQVEAAVELLPGPAVVVDLKPDFPFAPVEAGQEFGKPGGIDVGAVISRSFGMGHLPGGNDWQGSWPLFWRPCQSL